MIRLVEKEGVQRLLTACAGHPAGGRIYSALQAYGTEARFAEFWWQEREGEITGAISKISGDVTYLLFREDKEAREEMETFVTMLYGVRSVFTTYATSSAVESSPEMTCGITLRGENFPAMENSVAVEPLTQAGELYRFLCHSGEEALAMPMDDVAYADVSHRMRHGLLRGKGIRSEGGDLLACAVTTAESPKLAVIGGVYCRTEYRGQGYATALVQALGRELQAEGKQVLVFAYPGVEEFYRRQGFCDAGGWSLLTVK